MTSKLKEMIIKRAREQHKGLDIDGDMLEIFDKTYYVNIMNDKVEEVHIYE